jgi:death on curing protein
LISANLISITFLVGTQQRGTRVSVNDSDDANAMMESLANNHGFVDGNKRIAFTATDVLLRHNGFYIEVEGLDGYTFIDASLDRHEFRFAPILEWIRQHIKPLS